MNGIKQYPTMVTAILGKNVWSNESVLQLSIGLKGAVNNLSKVK